MKSTFIAFFTILLAPMAGAVNFTSLEDLVVQEGGRKKPYFVLADESMLGMSGARSLDINGQKTGATELVTRLWLEPDRWDDVPLIYVGHLPLKREAGLEESKKWFAYEELAANQTFLQMLGEAAAARERASNVRLQGLLKEAADVGMRIAVFEQLTNNRMLRIRPAMAGDWGIVPLDQSPVQELRAALLAADDAAFASAVESLLAWQQSIDPEALPAPWVIQLEVFYKQLHPFRLAWILYLASAIVLGITMGWKQKPGYWIGWALAGGGLLLQIFGFTARVLISGRAPVTNMYESIIWVAFGTVLFALIFEAIYRSRYFLLGAAPVAVLSLILADWHPVALDPHITPLVPVLQSNFWLTTHVLTITLSYAAFALALGISHIPLGQIILGRKPASGLYQYIYRALQVGVLLLAIGTILGGVWANYSWGRFWDWDPKETWALVALLAYLFILHGRIAGKWGGFGLSVGSILAFQTIIMAWYGVNFVLGTGLHSYGFGTGGLGYAITFVSIECAFVAAAAFRHHSQQNPKTSIPASVA